MKPEARRWLVTCSCGWGREASSDWAANAVSRLHQQLADVASSFRWSRAAEELA